MKQIMIYLSVRVVQVLSVVLRNSCQVFERQIRHVLPCTLPEEWYSEHLQFSERLLD